jgi:(p)ppGpp synthase/HD superfamily hydrolase
MILSLEDLEKDYNKYKLEFQEKEIEIVLKEIIGHMGVSCKLLSQVFSFIDSAFSGQKRNDKKTPLVFHSVYLAKMLFHLGETNPDQLILASLHDVLEDTDITEQTLLDQPFMQGRAYLIPLLNQLKEDKNLSREPDGIHLPERYREHISRLIGADVKVVNVELVDRFSDLMDLEYITSARDQDISLRLKSKLIKTKSYVYNLINKRHDFNQAALVLFEQKVKEIEYQYNLSADFIQL